MIFDTLHKDHLLIELKTARAEKTTVDGNVSCRIKDRMINRGPETEKENIWLTNLREDQRNTLKIRIEFMIHRSHMDL